MISALLGRILCDIGLRQEQIHTYGPRRIVISMMIDSTKWVNSCLAKQHLPGNSCWSWMELSYLLEIPNFAF